MNAVATVAMYTRRIAEALFALVVIRECLGGAFARSSFRGRSSQASPLSGLAFWSAPVPLIKESVA
jgi:hypothetical protein